MQSALSGPLCRNHQRTCPGLLECYIETMRKILEHRGLRLIFVANMISMLGSGLNAAAVTWYILQKTGSEEFLAYLVVFQTLPAVFLLPFSGVVIDREDRR